MITERSARPARTRLLAVAGTVALAAGGLLVTASPAAAVPAHCLNWNTHPDLYNSGGISFSNGTYLRSGPYSDCPGNGQGFPSQGINVHCAVINSFDYAWFYINDTSTGVNGWARYDSLTYSKSVSVPDCYSGAASVDVS